jgi:hypothetical protein
MFVNNRDHYARGMAAGSGIGTRTKGECGGSTAGVLDTRVEQWLDTLGSWLPERVESGFEWTDLGDRSIRSQQPLSDATCLRWYTIREQEAFDYRTDAIASSNSTQDVVPSHRP